MIGQRYTSRSLTREIVKPSCKRGTSKWSHSGGALNAQVFRKMLNLPQDGKAWKQRKLSIEDFQDAVGEIDASVSPLLREWRTILAMKTSSKSATEALELLVSMST